MELLLSEHQSCYQDLQNNECISRHVAFLVLSLTAWVTARVTVGTEYLDLQQGRAPFPALLTLVTLKSEADIQALCLTLVPALILLFLTSQGSRWNRINNICAGEEDWRELPPPQSSSLPTLPTLLPASLVATCWAELTPCQFQLPAVPGSAWIFPWWAQTRLCRACDNFPCHNSITCHPGATGVPRGGQLPQHCFPSVEFTRTCHYLMIFHHFLDKSHPRLPNERKFSVQ